MSRASYAGVDQGGRPVQVARPSYNGQFSFDDADEQHTLSFLDAISFRNHLRSVRGAKLSGIGISRLGTEDPQIWDVLEMRDAPSRPALEALSILKSSDTITHVGRGGIGTAETGPG